MHFLGASRDGLVARPVEMDKLSSKLVNQHDCSILDCFGLGFKFIGHPKYDIVQCWSNVCVPYVVICLFF
jgi:hypothetical protein